MPCSTTVSFHTSSALMGQTAQGFHLLALKSCNGTLSPETSISVGPKPSCPSELPGEALKIQIHAWKQPKGPSTGEQIKNVWYIYTMEYYSATKK